MRLWKWVRPSALRSEANGLTAAVAWRVPVLLPGRLAPGPQERAQRAAVTEVAVSFEPVLDRRQFARGVFALCNEGRATKQLCNGAHFVLLSLGLSCFQPRQERVALRTWLQAPPGHV